MEEKIEDYLKILYPDIDKIEKKESIIFERNKNFIAENIEKIEKRYKEYTWGEIAEESKEILVEEDELPSKEQEENDGEEIEKIEKEEVYSGNQSNQENVKVNDDAKNKEKLEDIIKKIKIDNYFNVLHPEYDNLEEEEKYYVLDDKTLIRENIDAIDAYYQDCKTPGSGAEFFEWTDQMIISTAITLFNKQEKIFTPNDIEQFSNKVKYEEFKQAISTIKEIANDEVEEINKEGEG